MPSNINTYLFTWNPKKFEWPDIAKDIALLKKGKKLAEEWTCNSHKQVKIGDRAFVARVGSLPRGIIGSGIITTQPYLAKHLHKNKMVYKVIIDFDTLLNADVEPILDFEILSIGKLAAQNWTPQGSGISIRPELVEELEMIWSDFIENRGAKRVEL